MGTKLKPVMPQPTPVTPWKVSNGGHRIFDADRKLVSYVDDSIKAALIVAAVNQHAALLDVLAALKAIMDLEDIDGHQVRVTLDYGSPIAEQARGVIRAAESSLAHRGMTVPRPPTR